MGEFYQSGQNQTSQTNGSTTGVNSSTTNPLEPDYFSEFRKNLIPNFQAALTKAQQPVYGQAQEAQFSNNNNANTNNALANLRSVEASKGILDSGASANAESKILQGGAANLSNYQTSVPGLNSQAYFANTGGLLGLGSNFAGRAPLEASTTGSQSGTTSQTGSIHQTTDPSGFSDLLGTIGGIAGIAGAGGGLK